jgi:hypothetical protein
MNADPMMLETCREAFLSMAAAMSGSAPCVDEPDTEPVSADGGKLGSRTKDLTGKVFGELTVIEYLKINKNQHAVWKCLCSCGVEREIPSKDLMSGNSKSCGHTNRRDLTGHKFNELTAIKYNSSDKKGNAKWLCLCSCGKETVTKAESLISGEAGSCGHNSRGLGSPIKKNTNIRKRYSTTRSRAKYCGRDFYITFEQFKDLDEQPCKYCNTHGSLRGGGIDRVDSSIGYTPENSVPCCRVCNAAKNAYTEDEFLSHAQKIVAHTIRRKGWSQTFKFAPIGQAACPQSPLFQGK